MARDYRYGHKPHKQVERRSQTFASDDAPVTNDHKQHSKRALREKPTDTPSSVVTDVTKPQLHSTSSKRALKYANNEQLTLNISPTRSPELQKALDKACSISQPRAIQKEAEAQAKALAEKEAALQAEQQQKALEKKIVLDSSQRQRRSTRIMWVLSSIIVVTVMLWIFYAPFFLAFAVQMDWISAETRDKWDSTTVRKQVMVMNDLKAPPPATAETLAQIAPSAVESQPPAPPPMTFTFYQELPRAAIHLAAQPLPVRTKAPVYLQVATIVQVKEATAERHRLAQKGYLVQMSTQVRNGHPVYVLRMGPYDDQRVINRLKVELQRLGVDAKEVNMMSMVKAEEAPSTDVKAPANAKATAQSIPAPQKTVPTPTVKP
jgi:hypothetical protein